MAAIGLHDLLVHLQSVVRCDFGTAEALSPKVHPAAAAAAVSSAEISSSQSPEVCHRRASVCCVVIVAARHRCVPVLVPVVSRSSCSC